MPIVMDLGFGEDGDAGDRETVSKQATRGHEVYPGSDPRRENPTPACLLLITAEPKVTGVRRCNLAWRCACGERERERASSSCPPSLYIDRKVPGIGRVGYKLGFAPLRFYLL